MWILHPLGFYSIIADKNNPDQLVVRARDREDLFRLCKKFNKDQTAVIRTATADYEFRLVINDEELAEMIGDLVYEIRYTNFKDEVSRTQGQARHDLYLRVWHVLREGLDRRLHPKPRRRNVNKNQLKLATNA